MHSQTENEVFKELDSLYALALKQMQTDQYYESLKIVHLIKDLAKKEGLSHYKADSENLLGLAYLQHYAYDKAEKHFLNAITINSKDNDTVSLAINYANLVHLYILDNAFKKYDETIDIARLYDETLGNRNRFYFYETQAMRLYQLKEYDSLINHTIYALNDIKTGNYFSVYTDQNQKDIVKQRLTLTFQLYRAYGLMEQKPSSDEANALLDKIKHYDLTKILWFSPRVYEHLTKLNYYKALYHIHQHNANLDSISFYKQKTQEYVEKTNMLLKEKSAINNQYVINAIENERKIEKLQIENENNKQKNSLIKRINLLSICIAGVFLVFLLYYYSSVKKIKKNIQEKEFMQKRIHQIQHELAKDLHDNFGNRLSGIITTLDILENFKTSNKNESSDRYSSFLGHFRKNSELLINDLKDLMWANNPANNNIRRISERFQNIVINFNKEQDIAIRFSSTIVQDFFLPPFWNRQLLLIFKEAITNAIKHSKATKIEAGLRYTDIKEIEIFIVDNGIGFDIDKISRKSGVLNISKRAKSIDFNLKITSIPNKGTRIVCTSEKRQIALMSHKKN